MIQLERLYVELFGEKPISITPLPVSGSVRRYFRLTSGQGTVIGAFNEDIRENRAFFSFAKTFRSEDLPVPEVLAVAADQSHYLLQDLGDVTLFSRMQESAGTKRGSETSKFDKALLDLYKRVVGWLPRFQNSAPDYEVCYPRKAFDRQSMMWDLNYFKYYYLKLAAIPFDEQKLEDDFNQFCSLLLEAPSSFFMYRDFQSRNIMITGNDLWFIDFQGGRRGPLQYDVASLLYDAKADLLQPVRDALLEYYLKQAEPMLPQGPEGFLKYFQGYSLIRILQAMGAYGFRGFYQKKKHFLHSIPYAIRNLETLIPGALSGRFPELRSVLERVVMTPLPAGILHSASGALPAEPERPVNAGDRSKVPLSERQPGHPSLLVTVMSFSYKNGIPNDPSGHGGGFVFDCRALPNPGRFEQFRELTGEDPDVIRFLQQEPEVNRFLTTVFQLVDQSVKKYAERNFTHLMVAFGCTGGQHRSVYCAERLTEHLRTKFEIEVLVIHRERSDEPRNHNSMNG